MKRANDFISQITKAKKDFSRSVKKLMIERTVEKAIIKKFKSQYTSAVRICNYWDGMSIDVEELYLEGTDIMAEFEEDFLDYAKMMCSIAPTLYDAKTCTIKFSEGDKILLETTNRLFKLQVRVELT
ncbi:hypothetical protein IJ114_00285 [Candidatus Saccharibacteria bacterium]|nr:hypothetical protein [Candidatus Saccharibacteria bacterium]